MRKNGEHTYIMTIDGKLSTQIVSGVELYVGDEINYRGNKLRIVYTEGRRIQVKTLGYAIIVQ